MKLKGCKKSKEGSFSQIPYYSGIDYIKLFLHENTEGGPFEPPKILSA